MLRHALMSGRGARAASVLSCKFVDKVAAKHTSYNNFVLNEFSQIVFGVLWGAYFARPEHRRCVVIPAQAIGLGFRNQRHFLGL